MFYFSFINRVFNSFDQEANERLTVIEIIGRHVTYGGSWLVCPLCSVGHTSMYLNGQTVRSSYGIHAIGSYGRFLKEGSMN